MTYPQKNTNGYGVLSKDDNDFDRPTNTIKIVAPTGDKQGLNVEPGGIVILGSTTEA